MYDIRDTNNNEYVIRKLADGNCWMTQNLRLTGPKTLTSADTDIASNYSLPSQNTSTWCNVSNESCVNTQNSLYSSNNDYGTYYSWSVAVANANAYSIASGDVASSICPKGWTIPTIDVLQSLHNSHYNSASALINSPVSLTLSGVRDGDNIRNQDSYGNYWSSTASSSNAARYIYFSRSNINSSTSSGKYNGISIRCIAK